MPVTLTGQIGEVIAVSNAVKGLNKDTINQILLNTPGGDKLGISPDLPNFHQYDVRTGVCVITNPNCTIENVFEALKRFPAPGATGEPVYNGAITDVTPLNLGPVVHYVNPDTYSVTNVTTGTHQLYPGIVFSQVYRDGEIICVQSIGFGNGPYPGWNAILADTVWGGPNAVDLQRYIEGITGADPRIIPMNYAPSTGNTELQLAMYGDGSRKSSEYDGITQHITSLPVDGTRIDTAFASDGSRLETKTDLANSFDWNREISSFIDNNPVNKIVINDNGAPECASPRACYPRLHRPFACGTLRHGVILKGA
jgi:hypothetical protein